MFEVRVTRLLPAVLLAVSLPFAAIPLAANASSLAPTPAAAKAGRHAPAGTFQRTGLMTTIAYGPNGETTTRTKAIDMRRYVESRGATILSIPMPAGILATPQAVATMGACAPRDVSTGCGSTTQPGGTDPTGPGMPPDINPDGSGPGAPAPDIPDPPMPDTLPCPLGTAIFVQFYAAGRWKQTTTYNRPVYDSGSDCSNGPWGEPVRNQDPVPQ